MANPLLSYVGKQASTFLSSAPFRDWEFTRAVEEDLAERIIDYVCEEHDLSITCDADETIRTIIIESELLEQLPGVLPFSLTREEVHAVFGHPSKSGQASQHPILGRFGFWDRFDTTEHAVHVEYDENRDRIKKLTLMRADVAP